MGNLEGQVEWGASGVQNQDGKRHNHGANDNTAWRGCGA